jgi:hypothetical protein
MELLCAGSALWIALTVGGLLALGGLIILLIKLGVIAKYATSPEPSDSSGDYTLEGSKTPAPEESRHGE